jgi:peptide/nickel transport system ATP-binding protein
MGIFEPNMTVTGSVWFDGTLQDAHSLAALRGHGLALVPQGVDSLNPLRKVGKQILDSTSSQDSVPSCRGRAPARPANVTTNENGQPKWDMAGGADAPPLQDGAAAQSPRSRMAALFTRYGLDPAVARAYPHQLSGGMARRVLLICALISNPRLIIADEPTPGLDLPLALKAMEDFRAFAQAGGGVLLITHDIELALRTANRIAVFKDGTVIEETAAQNFEHRDRLTHPFSQALYDALPRHGFADVDGGRPC